MNFPCIFISALFLAISTITFGQSLPEAGVIVTPDTIPFTLTSHNNISIQAIINDADTVNLMFHTAASNVTIITDAFAKTPSISWDQETSVNSWGGKSEAKFSTSNSIQIGKTKWTNQSTWETTNSGPTTDGKFGTNLFEDQILELDFDNLRMILNTTLPTKIDTYQKVALAYEDGYMFIEGTSTIGGQDYPHRFLIHSGYGGALMYDDAFAAESKIGERIEITSEQELKDSYGNILKTQKGTLSKFTIGNIALDSIPVGFFEGKIGRQQMSVLGGDLLKRFNLILDSKREFVYLKGNGLMGTSFKV